MIVRWEDFDALTPSVKIREEIGSAFTGGKDIEVVMRLAKSVHPKRVLEMYTNRGHTALHLASALPDSKIVTLDISREAAESYGLLANGQPNEILPEKDIGSEIKKYSDLAKIIDLRVIKTLPYSVSLLGKFDVVFIDGNHDFEGVHDDTLRALRVLSPEGMLIWDDYWPVCPGVMKLIDFLNGKIGSRIARVDPTRICFLITRPYEAVIMGSVLRNIKSCIIP